MGRIKAAGLTVRVAMIAAFAVACSGCSLDDVELNGGLFDAVGIGSNSKTKSEVPKMAPRAGLVLPPNLDRLPEPGSQPAEQSADLAMIDDPDRKAEVSKEELARQQAEYCKVNYEQALARGDRTAADLAFGPLGPCRSSILNIVDTSKSSDE